MSWTQLQTVSLNAGNDPVDLGSFLPTPRGTGNRGAARFVIRLDAAIPVYAVAPGDTDGVKFAPDPTGETSAQYEYGGEGGFTWPGRMPTLHLPAGAMCTVTVFVSGVRP